MTIAEPLGVVVGCEYPFAKSLTVRCVNLRVIEVGCTGWYGFRPPTRPLGQVSAIPIAFWRLALLTTLPLSPLALFMTVPLGPLALLMTVPLGPLALLTAVPLGLLPLGPLALRTFFRVLPLPVGMSLSLVPRMLDHALLFVPGMLSVALPFVSGVLGLAIFTLPVRTRLLTVHDPGPASRRRPPSLSQS
jgi:hypothetical protein